MQVYLRLLCRYIFIELSWCINEYILLNCQAKNNQIPLKIEILYWNSRGVIYFLIFVLFFCFSIYFILRTVSKINIGFVALSSHLGSRFIQVTLSDLPCAYHICGWVDIQDYISQKELLKLTYPFSIYKYFS